MMKKGWFGDSYRHMLSAKGVKTKRTVRTRRQKTKNPFIKRELFKYNAEKEEKKGFIEKAIGPPEGQKDMAEATIQMKTEEAQAKIIAARDAGKINDNDANEIRNGLDSAAQRYRMSSSTPNASELYAEDVKKETDKIARFDRTGARPFDWDVKKSPEKLKPFPTAL